jgi:hypothetical protein
MTSKPQYVADFCFAKSVFNQPGSQRTKVSAPDSNGKMTVTTKTYTKGGCQDADESTSSGFDINDKSPVCQDGDGKYPGTFMRRTYW